MRAANESCADDKVWRPQGGQVRSLTSVSDAEPSRASVAECKGWLDKRMGEDKAAAFKNSRFHYIT